MSVELSAAWLIAAIATAMALFFDYFPGVAAKWDALDEGAKKLWMAGLCIALGSIVFVGGCYGLILTGLACTALSAGGLLFDILVAIVTSQAVHALFKPTAGLKRKMFG